MKKSDRVVSMSRLEVNVTRGVWFVAGFFAAAIALMPNK
jgi:hypothetical protein